ncbi:hypothetical protein DFS34DRAFT_696826 [Phlyctochytrium arcticum]|nr:hypothetical protein DFS34DRAFT_696826 [Phlyctochytrium arcticum]
MSTAGSFAAASSPPTAYNSSPKVPALTTIRPTSQNTWAETNTSDLWSPPDDVISEPRSALNSIATSLGESSPSPFSSRRQHQPSSDQLWMPPDDIVNHAVVTSMPATTMGQGSMSAGGMAASTSNGPAAHHRDQALSTYERRESESILPPGTVVYNQAAFPDPNQPYQMGYSTVLHPSMLYLPSSHPAQINTALASDSSSTTHRQSKHSRHKMPDKHYVSMSGVLTDSYIQSYQALASPPLMVPPATKQQRERAGKKGRIRPLTPPDSPSILSASTARSVSPIGESSIKMGGAMHPVNGALVKSSPSQPQPPAPTSGPAVLRDLLNSSHLKNVHGVTPYQDGDMHPIFSGKLFKLGSNRRWQWRMFRFDGQLLTCLSNQKIKLPAQTEAAIAPSFHTPYIPLPSSQPAPLITSNLLADEYDLQFLGTDAPANDRANTAGRWVSLPKWTIHMGTVTHVSLLKRSRNGRSFTPVHLSLDGGRAQPTAKEEIFSAPISPAQTDDGEGSDTSNESRKRKTQPKYPAPPSRLASIKHCFSIRTTEGKTYVLRAKQAQDLDRWLFVIVSMVRHFRQMQGEQGITTLGYEIAPHGIKDAAVGRWKETIGRMGGRHVSFVPPPRTASFVALESERDRKAVVPYPAQPPPLSLPRPQQGPDVGLETPDLMSPEGLTPARASLVGVLAEDLTALRALSMYRSKRDSVYSTLKYPTSTTYASTLERSLMQPSSTWTSVSQQSKRVGSGGRWSTHRLTMESNDPRRSRDLSALLHQYTTPEFTARYTGSQNIPRLSSLRSTRSSESGSLAKPKSTSRSVLTSFTRKSTASRSVPSPESPGNGSNYPSFGSESEILGDTVGKKENATGQSFSSPLDSAISTPPTPTDGVKYVPLRGSIISSDQLSLDRMKAQPRPKEQGSVRRATSQSTMRTNSVVDQINSLERDLQRAQAKQRELVKFSSLSDMNISAIYPVRGDSLIIQNTDIIDSSIMGGDTYPVRSVSRSSNVMQRRQQQAAAGFPPMPRSTTADYLSPTNTPSGSTMSLAPPTTRPQLQRAATTEIVTRTGTVVTYNRGEGQVVMVQNPRASSSFQNQNQHQQQRRPPSTAMAQYLPLLAAPAEPPISYTSSPYETYPPHHTSPPTSQPYPMSAPTTPATANALQISQAVHSAWRGSLKNINHSRPTTADSRSSNNPSEPKQLSVSSTSTPAVQVVAELGLERWREVRRQQVFGSH